MFAVGFFYFFYFTAMAVYIIFAPKALLDLGYTALQIGVLLAISPLVRFLSPFLFLKKIKLTASAFFISLILSILFASLFAVSIYSFWLTFFVTFCFSIFWGVILPFVDTHAFSFIAKERYGRVRLFGSVGFMLTALFLGRFEPGAAQLFWIYLLSITLTAVGGAACLIGANKVSRHAVNEDTFVSAPFSLLPHAYFWLSLFFLQFGFGAFYNFFSIFESAHGLQMSQVTMLWAFGVACEILMFTLQGGLLRRFDMLALIKFTTAMTIIRWMLLEFSPGSFGVGLLSQSFHALNFALYTTAVFAYLFSIYEDKRVAQLFFYGISYGLGGFFGSLVSGVLYGMHIFLFATFTAVAAYLSLLVYEKKVS